VSAQELRDAAAAMRARAEACLASDDQWYERDEMLEMLRSKDSDSFAQPYDAEHIASWHPAVALAVADSLIAAAAHIESFDCEAHCEPDGCELVLTATRTARTYLGSAS
jgi:hypothetical protein